MRRRTVSTAAAMLLALGLGGCSETTASDGRLDGTGLEAYGGGLHLYAFESPGVVPGLSPSRTFGYIGVREPRVVLGLSTFADRGHCERLESAVDIVEGRITLYPGRVGAGSHPCTTGPDQPARSSHFVPVAEGTHLVLVQVGGNVQEFSLLVTGTYIRLRRISRPLPASLLRGGVVEPDTKNFWRFPLRSLAFYCVGSDAICNAAASRLTDELSLQPLRFPASGHVPFEAPFYDGEEVRHFTYPSEEALIGIHERVCRIMPNSTGTQGSPMIRVVTWRGEGASSWGSCG